MIMQMPPLQEIPCRADHLPNLHDEYGAPAVAAAVVASCEVPAQIMPASCKPKFLRHAHTAHCEQASLHTQPYIHPHSCTEIGNLSTHDNYPAEHHQLSYTPPPMQHNVDDFTPLGTLGRGNMGTVVLVLSKHSPGSPFALKITHSLSSKKQRSHVEREILSSLHHPFLQTLHAHFELASRSLLLLDFCSGGDLNLLRHRQPEKRFSETAARFYAAEVVMALEHLHSLGIVYRDLKPENILVQDSGHIKLTDFDLSLKLATGQKESLQSPSRLPVCSLQQQLDSEADAHKLQLRAGMQRLHCGSAFTCLMGRTCRNEKGAHVVFSNHKREEKGYGCWVDGKSSSRRRKVSAKQRGVCGFKCLCRARESDADCWSSRAKKNRAKDGGITRRYKRRSKLLGNSEALKAQESTKRGQCIPCFNTPEIIEAEERSVYVVGTDEYVAPEVLRGEEHSFSMDWWSFGVLLYEMIYGHTPFKGATTQGTLCNILRKQPEFPGMKSPAKDLIAQLLVKDPSTRLGLKGAQAIKQHPFFNGLHWESLPRICRPPFIPSPLCLSELEERYPAKLKPKSRELQHKLSGSGKSWLEELVYSMEAAEKSSYSRTSSSAGFVSSSADGADREIRRDDDGDTLFSSAEWSSELNVCVHRPPS